MDMPDIISSALSSSLLVKDLPDKSSATGDRNAASQQVVEALCAGCCEPWLGAYLLGYIGHASGYNAARKVLLAGGRSCVFGASAMVAIRGKDAYGDLLSVLNSVEDRHVRRAAALAMGETGEANLCKDLLHAVKCGRLSCSMAARIGVEVMPPVDILLKLGNSTDPSAREFYYNLVYSAILTGWSDCQFNEVASLARDLVANDVGRMTPYRMQRMLEVFSVPKHSFVNKLPK